ncbi:hypothetical protein Tco_0065038 [Tanacetum coccineum]
MDKILKKFGFSTVRIASTPMETSNPLLKDSKVEDVDVHLYRSMIGPLMYLTTSRPDIMFVVCACARFQVTPKVSHLHDMKRIFRYLKGQSKLGLKYPKDSPFNLEAYNDSDYAGASIDRKSITRGWKYYKDGNEVKTGNLIVNAAGHYLVLLGEIFNDEYDTPSHTKKVFANLRRQGKDFSRKVTPLFETMLIQHLADVSEGSRQPIEPQHTPTTTSPSHFKSIPIVPSSSQPQKTHKRRKTKRPTEISQSSRPTTLVAHETVYEERDDRMERAATTASSLEAEQDSGNILRTQSMATLNKPIPQGTGSGCGPRRQDTILRDRPA